MVQQDEDGWAPSFCNSDAELDLDSKEEGISDTFENKSLHGDGKEHGELKLENYNDHNKTTQLITGRSMTK